MNRIALTLLAGVATLGFASSTLAADLIVSTPVVSPGVVDVSGSWDGAYIGGFVGYGWGDADGASLADVSPTSGPYPTDGVDTDISGWLAGVKLGYNFHATDGVVVGVVGDLAWSGIGGEVSGYGAPYTFYNGTTHEINWAGSVRGIIGFDGGAFLPYLTGGLAVANATRTNASGSLEASATHFGWTVGAGVEVAVADNVSLNLEYRYSDYGTQTYEWEVNPSNYDDAVVGITAHTVTAGINFHF